MKTFDNGQPLVSVIIPNYNHTRFIRGAIQSILAQTYSRYEIIVVDDGSTDDSREVVSRFGDKVRYIWQENKGLGGARNTGILASDAKFIGLLDADDEWEPTYLEKMMSLVQSCPDAVVYFSGAQSMNADGNNLPQIFGRMISPNDIYQNLLRANFIIPSTVIFRRNVIVHAGLFEEKNRELHGCEDWDLWLRLSPLHKFVGIPEPLVRYRLHNDTFSTNLGHMQKAVMGVIEQNFGIDDGKYVDWSMEKRRAYGGGFRYQAITFIQRQKNWNAAGASFQKALRIDPSLAVDLDFFYELALESQQAGYRGVSTLQGIETNAIHLQNMVLKSVKAPSERAIRKKALGTSYLALGVASYDLGTRSQFRKYYGKALMCRPELILNFNLVAKYLKSFFSKEKIESLKKLVGRHS
jgi:glycosyltransferase involved in cell wall biosynthesis